MSQGLARVISIDEVKISNDIDQPVLVTPGTYEAVMVDWKVNYNGMPVKLGEALRFVD